MSAATPDVPSRHRLITHLAPQPLPSAAHLLALLGGLALILLAPRLASGTRTAVSLALGALLTLAVLNIAKGLDYEDAMLDVCLALVLALGRGAFPLGSRNRPRVTLALVSVASWALMYCALLIKPLFIDHGHTIGRALHHTIAPALHASTRLDPGWSVGVEALVAVAAVTSLLTVRSLLRPAPASNGHAESEYRMARAIIERWGVDSLSPFMLRPDKALHFTGGAVLAYRVIGETAVVSGDPVGPPAEVREVLSSFLALARRRGWRVVLWGASDRYLEDYRALGLRGVCAGEEAFVDPSAFTLEGRRVRKLRQSVHRVERRGWQITAREGRDLDEALESEIDTVEGSWRAARRRLHGFAMGMAGFDPGIGSRDLYLLARSPEGELRAVMRFVAHCGKLSLDTMRRTGETPNGLNEAMICRALEYARERDVPEVSLNYAGLAHLVRGKRRRGVSRAVLTLLSRRFQLERLVCFNEKFTPTWRPRYLLYEPTAGFGRATLRVMQAEGYVPQRIAVRPHADWGRTAPALPQLPRAGAAA